MKLRTVPPRQRQRGAALLIAMVLLTLVATLAAGMVWQQWRAVQVETAERGRAQLAWVLNGAIDWARLILRSDLSADKQKGRMVDDLSEPWAQPLEEARLSTFLSADKDNSADTELEAFLAGSISDAQARYNLRNLVTNEQKVSPAQLEVLKRLCALAGLPAELAEQVANGLAAANAGQPDAPLLPMRLEDLAWLGIDSASIERLRPLVWLQPVAPGAPASTAVNLNTAPRDVIAAVLNVDAGSAERLVQLRSRKPLTNVEEAKTELQLTADITAIASVQSNFFEVRGRMRLNDRVLEEVTLVRRDDQNVTVLQRQRAHSVLASAP